MAGSETRALVVAEGGGDKRSEYRKGNWTLHETMVLIEAKKMDNERRMRRESEGRMGSSSSSSSRPSELRWKWVEDYCWKYGCNRSQNQCNDKWDNLMRDYKKVRNYEMMVGGAGAGGGGSGGGGGGGGGGGCDMNSYWKLDRHERKDRNLPSNFLPQVYEALFEVVEFRREGGSVSNIRFFAMDRQISGVHSLPLLLQDHSSNPNQELPPLSLIVPPLQHAQVLPTLDSGASEYSTSPPRKRRRRRIGSSCSNNTTHDLDSALSKSAAILVEALIATEEKEEMRHKDLVSVKERKLKVEESNAEINALAMDGLVNAINKLVTSILGLVSERQPRASK